MAGPMRYTWLESPLTIVVGYDFFPYPDRIICCALAWLVLSDFGGMGPQIEASVLDHSSAVQNRFDPWGNPGP